MSEWDCQKCGAPVGENGEIYTIHYLDRGASSTDESTSDDAITLRFHLGCDAVASGSAG